MWAWARLLSALGLERDDAGGVVQSTSRALPPAQAGSEVVSSEIKGWPGKWVLALPRWSSLGVSGCEGCGSPRTRGPEQAVSAAAWADLARRWPALRRAVEVTLGASWGHWQTLGSRRCPVAGAAWNSTGLAFAPSLLAWTV